MRDSNYLIPWNKNDVERKTTEMLVLGSGIAGLFTAIKLSADFKVTVLTKSNIRESNTEHAQGGIAVALNEDDSPEFHFGDTIKAGAGLCNIEAVKILAENGPECVREIIAMGAQFDKLNDRLKFTREAAHSKSRVLHAKGDATGEEIEKVLVADIKKRSIEVQENVFVIDLLINNQGAVAGVLALNNNTGRLEAWLAKAVILATGGLGRLYKYTTNPEVTTGDGIAAAYRAGAELMDMEFIQFHPTALLLKGAPTFLISEAARGEGAKLINSRGEYFMESIPDQELAPRDVVARAIWNEMREGQVFLDFRNLGTRVKERFPSIYKNCLQYGIDLTTTPVPVGPAAHYLMGGVKVNIAGETNLANLYACGECACNGVHGANRLASNSLLDGLVFAKAITERIRAKNSPLNKWEDIVPPANYPVTAPKPSPDAERMLEKIREIMWSKVGIIRDAEGLKEAMDRLQVLWEEYEPDTKQKSLEVANMLTLSLVIVQAALSRQESRGGHYRSDFPETRNEWQKHSVQQRGVSHVRYVSI
ncbi:MAG TPA: L-aspartate oxidase [Peptococcaceae bacterium]|nr:L-aspartate oxidase [Peptococcaceae bacterium]